MLDYLAKTLSKLLGIAPCLPYPLIMIMSLIIQLHSFVQPILSLSEFLIDLHFLLLKNFLLERVREQARASKERSRGRGRENLKQTPHWVWSPMRGSNLWPWNHDLSQNQEFGLLNPMSHPGAPLNVHFLKSKWYIFWLTLNMMRLGSVLNRFATWVESGTAVRHLSIGHLLEFSLYS